MARRARVFFVDDDANLLQALMRQLWPYRREWKQFYFDHPASALHVMEAFEVSVLVSDYMMPEMTGLDLIQGIRKVHPQAGCILLTGTGDYDLARRAIATSSVFRMLDKPCETTRLVAEIREAVAAVGHQDAHLRSFEFTQTALGLFDTAVILVDAHTGRIVFANQGGEMLLNESDGITRDEFGILRAVSKKDCDSLRVAIQTAPDHADDSELYVSLARQSGARDYSVSVRAIDADYETDRVVAVMVHDPERDRTPSTRALVDLFQLTPAEARIAHAIAQGVSVNQAAASHGLKPESARTYLKRVYAKLDVTGQNDLVRLILNAS